MLKHCDASNTTETRNGIIKKSLGLVKLSVILQVKYLNHIFL